MIKITSEDHVEKIGNEPIDRLWVSNFTLENSDTSDKKELFIDAYPYGLTNRGTVITNKQKRFQAKITDLEQYMTTEQDIQLFQTYQAIQAEICKILIKKNPGLELNFIPDGV